MNHAGARVTMSESFEFHPEIRLEKVSYYYPETEQLVFNDLSIELAKEDLIEYYGGL